MNSHKNFSYSIPTPIKTPKSHHVPMKWGWVKTLVPSEPQFIAGKWMFIPLKMYLYPNPYFFMAYTNYQRLRTASQQLCGAQSRDGHLRPRFPPDGRYQIRDVS